MQTLMLLDRHIFANIKSISHIKPINLRHKIKWILEKSTSGDKATKSFPP